MNVKGVRWERAYDQSELWRTRRCVPESGFLTTIQNMIDVAKLNAYLRDVSGV